MDFERLATEQFVTFVLVLCRISGIFLVTPLLGGSQMPWRLRVFLSVALSVAVYPLVTLPGVSVPTQGARLVLGLTGELCVGLVCGFVVNVVFVAAQMGGALLSRYMGTALAEVLNPLFEPQLPILGQFYYMFALVVFFAVNGHHILLAGLVKTFDRVPLMGVEFRPGMVASLTGLLGDMFVLMIKIAAPTFVVLFLVTAALGVVSRIVPQTSVVILGFPLTVCLGLVVASLTLAAAAALLGDSFAWVMNQMDLMLRFMVPRP